ncbi:MAG: DUF692 domain-containing protein [Gammaproteobacteria bacterium]|nr:DUF692 domain-containing protein [Gammaproteobacteria bacterium]
MSAAAGIGLKPAHYRALLTDRPPLGFLEIHTENYMGAGGSPHRYLAALAESYPLSFHGVGMSLGGAGPLNRSHLARWRELVDRYDPTLVSEHVAWSSHDGYALHDLLPIPYTEESLRALCEHIEQMQDVLGRRILIENPSRYLEFSYSDTAEPEFLVEATARTGCGLLLDLNNVFVSTCNQGEDATRYLARIPSHLVEEIHLAGHSINTVDGEEIRIDDHGSPVCDPVWQLYRDTVSRIGRRPTLIEWDTDVPEIEVLLGEAERANEAAAVPSRDSIQGNRYALAP